MSAFTPDAACAFTTDDRTEFRVAAAERWAAGAIADDLRGRASTELDLTGARATEGAGS